MGKILKIINYAASENKEVKSFSKVRSQEGE